MKRYFINITAAMLAGVAFTACSDDAITNDGMTMQEALAPSEYAIELDADASNLTAKAAIKSDQGSFKTEDLGVFMLAMNKINTTLTPFWGFDQNQDCSWYRDPKQTKDSKTYGYTYGFVAYIDNMPATASPKSAADPAQGSKIMLKNGEAERYPVGSFHRYNFYAYTPRAEKIEYKKDSVVAVMTNLNGTQDVIYSAAIPGDENNTVQEAYKDYAWSANYFRFRQNRDDATDMPKANKNPKFHFTHKMMQLMFNVQPGGLDADGKPVAEDKKEDNLNYDPALETEIIGISIVNIPDTIRLVVADRSGMNNGDLTYSSDNRTQEWFLKSYVAKKSTTGTTYYADQVMPAQSLAMVQEQAIDEEGNPMVDADGNPIMVNTNTPVVTKLGGPDAVHRQGMIVPAISKEDRLKPDGCYMAKVVVKYPKSSEDAKYYEMNVPLDSDPQNPEKQFKPGSSYEIYLRIYGPNTVTATSQEREWHEVDIEDLRKGGNYDVPAEEETNNP